jgi:hypothetical protein
MDSTERVWIIPDMLLQRKFVRLFLDRPTPAWANLPSIAPELTIRCVKTLREARIRRIGNPIRTLQIQHRFWT